MTTAVELELRELLRTLKSEEWHHRLDRCGLISAVDRAAWVWSLACLGTARLKTVSDIKRLGGLLLIGGVYRELDRAQS